MEIGRGGPNAVERRRLVANRRLRFVFFREPAAVVVFAEFAGEAVEALAVGADLVDGNDLVGIGPVFAVGSVTAGAVGDEQRFALFRQQGIDRQGILRRLNTQ